MKEIITKSLCDRCLARDGTKIEAARNDIRVAIGKREVKVDLCEKCLDPWFQELEALVLALAPKARAGSADPKDTPGFTPVTCQCGDQMTVRDRNRHAKSRHQTDSGALRWLWPDSVAKVWLCGDRECRLPFPTYQGMVMHCAHSSHEQGSREPSAPRRSLSPAGV